MIFKALQDVRNRFQIESGKKWRIIPLPMSSSDTCGLQFTKEYHTEINVRVPISTLAIWVDHSDTVETITQRLIDLIDKEVVLSNFPGFMLHLSHIYVKTAERGTSNPMGGGLFIDLVPAVYDGQRLHYQVIQDRDPDSGEFLGYYDSKTHTVEHALQTAHAIDVKVWDTNVHREYTSGKVKGREVFPLLRQELEGRVRDAGARLSKLEHGYAVEEEIRSTCVRGHYSVAAGLLQTLLKVPVHHSFEFESIRFVIDGQHVALDAIHEVVANHG